MVEFPSGESFVKIVYAKVQSNGKTQLVPLKLSVDGSLEHLNREILADRYEIQRVLGQGGFGRTYLAFDRHRFNEPCVVKEFLPQNLNHYESQKSRELFEREAKILYQINHPQVPKFFACFEEDDKLFIVQEYIKGKTYSTLLQERQQRGANFSESEIIQLLKDLLPILNYVHDRHIIHRDISLDNIMLTEEGHLPILIDFGIGKYNPVKNQNQENNLSIPMSYSPQKTIVGKIGYAPHEQLLLGQSSPSSDLYSLAVTAVVLLTGMNPQPVTNQPSLKQQWQFYTSVSDGFIRIINRMLQDSPSYRYQSAAAVLADLERVVLSPQTQLSQPVLNAQATVLNIQPTVPQPQLTVPQAQISSFTSLNARFVTQCEQELTNYVGPIAKFLVQNTLAKNPNISPEELGNLLSKQISQPSQAIEFRKRIFRET